MEIRSASLIDINELAQLFDAYRVFYGKDADLARAKQFLTKRLNQNDSTIFVAEVDNTLAGFVQLYPLFSSTRMQELLLLNDLFVSKMHRGKGISVKLIDAAKAYCRKIGACGLSLETEKNNTIGNQLYPRTNFELDTEHNYYFWACK